MTRILFIEWLKKVDSSMRSQNRKILMFVDNFSGHDKIPDIKDLLPNVNLQFYPANCTSQLQPLDQGIINSFKCHYKNKIVAETIQAIDHGHVREPIDMLNTIYNISSAWKSVSSTTIQNCFTKSGHQLQATKNHSISIPDVFHFEPSVEPIITEFEKNWNRLKQSDPDAKLDFSCFEYLNVDKHLMPFGTRTHQQIIEVVRQASPSLKEQELDSESENVIDIPKPSLSHKQILDMICKLRDELASSSSDFSDQVLQLNDVKEKVQSIQQKTHQPKINNYFS